jgi:hypothetical protein
VKRHLALLAALAVLAAGVSPGISALCGGSPGAMTHACCAGEKECGTLAPQSEMACCEAAPAQAPAGAQPSAAFASWAGSFAALPASAPAPAVAAPSRDGASDAGLAPSPGSLSTLCPPLRL